MPAQHKKYKATTWATEPTLDLEVPSGQLCLVRRPGVTGLIRAGILDSLDSLTSIVQTDHIERVEADKRGGAPAVSAEAVKALQGNKEKLLEAMDLMDKVLSYVVVEPKLYLPYQYDEDKQVYVWDGAGDARKMVPIADAERVPGRAYVDMVDLMDKLFVFQFVVGGVSDLETFRKEFGESMAGLEAVADVPPAAQ